MALVVALLGSTACAEPRPSDSTAGSTTSMSSTSENGSDTSTTTDATETGTNTTLTTVDTDDTADDSDITSGSFYAGPEPDLSQDCDPFAQDCPEGEKCVPYSTFGGNLNANKCVPVIGEGAPGDPCTYGGTFEATDDCGQDSYCWVAGDTGECVAFCGGTPDEPTCPMDINCLISNNGAVNLCVPPCNPLLQACADGFGCYYTNPLFDCVPTSENIALGDPCNSINDCAIGLACLPGDVVPNCANDSCCASYCDIGAPVCSAPGTECVPFFADTPPPGYEDVGVCVLPP